MKQFYTKLFKQYCNDRTQTLIMYKALFTALFSQFWHKCTIFAPVTRWLQLRFDCSSTAVRLPSHCISTALQPFDGLHYTV